MPTAKASDWLLTLILPGTPYGRKALLDELGILRATPAGERNNQTNRASFLLSQLIEGGELGDRDGVASLIYRAGIESGLTHDETVRTIQSGMEAGAKELRKAPVSAEKLGKPQIFNKPLIATSISSHEWQFSRLHPQIIVDNYLFADVAILIAPGGIGKTTLTLNELIHIVLGMSLYAKEIRKPGKVVIVSAEDSREQIIARIVRIAMAMNLSPEQVEHLKHSIIILYVGGENFRLSGIDSDIVTISANVDRFVKTIEPLKPVLVVFDPAVSFGVGESRVNDAEQGLIMAGRRIRDTLGCCVRFIHHTGKANARDGVVDQYAGRGGSAMADGSRMVAVLKRMEPKEWLKETGEALPEGSEGLLLALPKLSYCPPQPHIYIERTGFSYRHVAPTTMTAEDKRAATDAQVIEFLRNEELQQRFHSKSTLEQCESLGIPRKELRAAIARLEVAGRISVTKHPGRGQGQCIRLTEYSPPVPASNDQFNGQWGEQ